jgi:hypothetical protein
MRWYREWLPKLPEDVYAFYLTAEVPPGPPFPEEIHGRKVCGLLWCCLGSAEEAEKVMQEARDVAEPIFEFTGPMPYPMLQGMFDEPVPAGRSVVLEGDVRRRLE